MRSRWVGVVLGLTLVVAATAVAPAASELRVATGSLNLQATLGVVSDPIQCPADAPPDATECRARTGQGLVRRLGLISENYTWSYRVGAPTCPANLAKPLATTGRLVVPGKGEITLALGPGASCVDVEPVRNEPQDFTITGGTGPYAAASGKGIVERSLAGGAGTGNLEGNARCAGSRVRPGAAEVRRSIGEDGTGGKRGEDGARYLQGDSDRRHRRGCAGLVPAQVGEPLQGWPDEGALRSDRFERKHGQGLIHGHREAAQLTVSRNASTSRCVRSRTR